MTSKLCKDAFIQVRLDTKTKHLFSRFALQHRKSVSAFIREEAVLPLLETAGGGLRFLSRAKEKETNWTARRLQAAVDIDESMESHTRQIIRELIEKLRSLLQEAR